MKKVVGVDPGKDGGICLMDNFEVIELFPIPRIKSNVDYKQLAKDLEFCKEYGAEIFYIEEVHSLGMSGKKSNFSFGEIFGVKQGMFSMAKYPYDFVQPKEWQGVIWSNIDKVYSNKKKKTVDTKATSESAALRLYPEVDFKKSERATKNHDGLIDSALVARYGTMKLLGQTLKLDL
jgi:hypothetical protein